MHAGLVAFGFRQIPPDFLSREDEDRGDQAHQGAGNLPDGCLCRTARFALCSFRIKAIFENVEIKGTQVNDTEVVNGMIDAVEIVSGIPLPAPGHEFGGALEHPAIHFLELIVWETVA